MKTILCFGDSNTWGYDPGTRSRYDRETRWTGILQKSLGVGYTVIEEGLNGRTTVHEDPFSPFRPGSEYLPACLESHAPIDLITIMLGTNDLKARFRVGPAEIAEGATSLAKKAMTSGTGTDGANPRVLLICPPPILEIGPFAAMFAGGAEKSQQLAAAFAFWVENNPVAFIDAGTIVRSSDVDGIHLDADQHTLLGQALATHILSILG